MNLLPITLMITMFLLGNLYARISIYYKEKDLKRKAELRRKNIVINWDLLDLKKCKKEAEKEARIKMRGIK